jgi:formamidopyrimidine-DNA glycosylase
MLSEAEFSKLLLQRSGSIKGALLDQAIASLSLPPVPACLCAEWEWAPQSFSAGVGNWVADEVLYQAGVHPETACSRMTTAQVNPAHAVLTPPSGG